jgi:GNAT superfamily N-acetyltransferase
MITLMNKPSQLLLRDGRTATMREITHHDLEPILAMGSRCSDESIQNRFFGPRREPSDTERALITDIDGRDRHGILVELDGDVIAVGRWIRVEPNTAPELAFLVEDRHQGVGVGSALLDALVTSAERAGHVALCATVLGGNEAMLRLFDRGPRPLKRSLSGGVWDIELTLAPR